GKRARIALIFRPGLENHAVLIGLTEDRRDLTLAEGVIERIADRLHGDAQSSGFFPVDLDIDSKSAVLRFGSDVVKQGIGAQPGPKSAGPMTDFCGICRRQGVLKKGARRPRADLDVLKRLEIDD